MTIVTGRRAAGSDLQWGKFFGAVDTLVILMGLKNIKAIMNRLQAEGCPADCPAAVIQSGTLPAQRTAVGTVASIAEASERRGFGSPAVIVVGKVASFAGKLDWFSGAVAGRQTGGYRDDPHRIQHAEPSELRLKA